MAMEIIKFEKSPLIRLKEIMDVLCCGDDSDTPTGVQDQWKYFVELVVEPVGWQAMWRVSRCQCEKFQITFPTLVYVEVIGVDFCSLNAIVQVLGVQDDIDIPERCVVSLTELYPTLSQENNVLNIEETANCIDQLRFFYEHVWFPWDYDKNDAKNWATNNLQSRIELFFDMQSDNFARETVVHIRTLLEEAKYIHSKLNALRNDTDTTILEVHNGNDCLESSANANWVELQLRMKHIQVEVEALEIPALRRVVMKMKEHMPKESNNNVRGLKEICFVWPGGLMDDFMQASAKAKEIFGSVFIQSFNSAHTAVEQATEGDTVVLCAGIHEIAGLGRLQTGGVIMGISSLPSDTLVQEKKAQRYLLDASANAQTVQLQNITLSSSVADTLLLVRSGTVHLTKCHLVGDNASKQQGILVMAGAKLIMEDCEFRDLAVVLIVNTGAEITLNNCSASGCCTGLKILGKSNISMKKCKFLECKDYGIIVENHNESIEEMQVGSIDILEKNELNILDESLMEGQKGSVMIRNKNVDAFFLEDEEY